MYKISNKIWWENNNENLVEIEIQIEKSQHWIEVSCFTIGHMTFAMVKK